MARTIGVDDIRDAIGSLQAGESTLADCQSLIREALASGALSQSDANRALQSARRTAAVESGSLEDLRDQPRVPGPRFEFDAHVRSSQETRVRVTGVNGGGNVVDFTHRELGNHAKDWSPTDNSEGTDALWINPDPAAVSSASPNMVGQLLGGRYLLERELGGGGMGVVYLASDQEITGELFAIKVMRKEIQAYPEALPMLREEVRTTRALRHPNIVGVYSLNSDKRNIYMLMEYLEGKTLDALLSEQFGRGMPFSRAWPLILDMCDALAYAHDHNVIHSDLKPSNVFVTMAGRAKILDFGIARVARTRDGRFDPGTLVALTLAYASIEMLEGQQPDQRDDVYALACVIYEMLSGKHPYDLRSALQAQAGRMQVAPIPALTPAQNTALAQALQVRRANRTSTVEALLAGLDASDRAAAAARPGAPTLTRERRNTVPFADVGSAAQLPSSSSESRWRKPLLIALISLVCIGIAAGVYELIDRVRIQPEARVAPIAAPPATVTPDEPAIAATALPEADSPPTEPIEPIAPVDTADAPPSTAIDNPPPLVPAPPVSQTPSVVQAPPVVAALPHAERRPAPSESTLSDAGATSDTNGIPAVSKHPLAVAPLDESIDPCPYPATALKLGQTGSVGLLVYISPDGDAIDTRLEDSSGSEELDGAAVACVQQHGRFAARRLGSKVQGYWGRMRFNWSFGG